MKLFFVLVAMFALVVPAASKQDSRVAEESPAGAELKQLPEIKLQDFAGKAVGSEKLKGSVLVLDFWATWCGPCIAEIPTFNHLQEKYADKGVKVIGVTLSSGEAKEVQPFVTRNKMKYTILMGDDDQAYDFNIIGFPTTILVTRDGKIFRRYVGTGPRKAEQIDSDIQKLLGAR
jgi:thiol-disulfide isomerase/thioredoxin